MHCSRLHTRSSFFPNAGRHPLYVYPKMFTQTEKEQVDTLVHEIGHVFGLRHYFAPESESEWPSEIFGEHKPFSIMNYGAMSELTETDRSDLRNLYQSAWSGKLTKINRTPIKLVRPFHYLNASGFAALVSLPSENGDWEAPNSRRPSLSTILRIAAALETGRWSDSAAKGHSAQDANRELGCSATALWVPTDPHDAAA